MSTETNKEFKQKAEEDYKYGWVTDVDSETAPPGLNEDIVRWISKKKNEPEFLLNWRLKAFKHFQSQVKKGQLPDWANIEFNQINFDDIIYYSAPKPKLESLDQVDEEVLKTFEKLGIPLDEQKRLSGVAVDAVFDSVSIATTFKDTLMEKGIIFCSFSEAVQEYPELIEKYLSLIHI